MTENETAKRRSTFRRAKFPCPGHLSPEAQAWLAMPRASGGAGYPALDDAEGWRQHIAAMDAMVMQMYMHRPPAVPCAIRELTEGDCARL